MKYYAVFTKKKKELRQCYNEWKTLVVASEIYEREGWTLIDAFRSDILDKEDFIGG